MRHSLEYVAQGDWNEEEVEIYSKMLSDVIINANESTASLIVPIGLQTHIANMFPEELAKVVQQLIHFYLHCQFKNIVFIFCLFVFF